MNYQDFISELSSFLEEKFPEKGSIQIKKVLKNNGSGYTGIFFRQEENGAAPILYGEPLFDALQSGTSLSTIKEQAAEAFAVKNLSSDMVRCFQDFGAAGKLLVFRLLKKAGNEAYLQDLPGRDFLDLRLTYGLYLTPAPGENGMAPVTVKMMEGWGKTEAALYDAAAENTPRLLGDRLFSIRHPFSDAGAEGNRMFVLTNRSGFYGAAALLYSEETGRLSDRFESDLLLLPASVHEWFAVPALPAGWAAERIDPVIRGINASHLRPEEVLSDHCYVYSRKKKQVEVPGKN